MLITFSGIDGSGRTTCSESVGEAFRRRKLPAFSGRPLHLTCKAVESFCEAHFGSFVTRLDPHFYPHALMADWLEHLARTLRHHDGKIIICDRSIYVLFVLYGTEPAEALRLVGYFPHPRLSYFLTISPESSRARIDRRGYPPRDLEGLDDLNGVWGVMLAKETSAPDNPVYAVTVAKQIIEQVVASGIDGELS